MRQDPDIAILTAARALIATPDRWCVIHGRHMAMDAAGNACCHLGPVAVRWELLGAVERATADLGYPLVNCIGSPLTEAVTRIKAAVAPNAMRGAGHVVAGWHAHPKLTHAEVLRAIDRAVAMARP